MTLYIKYTKALTFQILTCSMVDSAAWDLDVRAVFCASRRDSSVSSSSAFFSYFMYIWHKCQKRPNISVKETNYHCIPLPRASAPAPPWRRGDAVASFVAPPRAPIGSHEVHIRYTLLLLLLLRELRPDFFKSQRTNIYHLRVDLNLSGNLKKHWEKINTGKKGFRYFRKGLSLPLRPQSISRVYR